MQPFFVGIDVSKATLDVVVRSHGANSKAKTYANNRKGIAELVRCLAKQPTESVRVCLEATGQYGEEVTETLYQHGYAVSVVNPVRTKRYAQSSLTRSQTDQVDAALIAEFLEARAPRLWVPPSPAHKAARALSRRLDDLQHRLQMERNRLKAAHTLLEEVESSITQVIQALKAQIKEVKRQLEHTVQSDPELKRQKELLQSIPGIGALTAIRFLAELGDLRGFADAKQLAAFLGLTPESKTSGTSVHTKPHLSKKGSAAVRHHLYMPAIVAKHHNPIAKAFADRLRAARKLEMAIIGAVMHKLVHLMFGVVHSGRVFDPLYLHKQALPS